MNVSRRSFIKASSSAALIAATGEFALHSSAFSAVPLNEQSTFNAWLRIGQDDSITIQLSQSEMGQGISTTLPLALADELGADWTRVKTEWSPFGAPYRHPQYGWMFTGNSESSSTFYPIMRKMGAAARMMLSQAAATRWKVDAGEVIARDGRIVHPPSARSLSFGALAKDAAQLPAPEHPVLKSNSELKFIGKPQARLDIPAKVDGSARFGIDVVVPGMLVAALRRAPSPGAKLQSFDKTALSMLPGVKGVVEIPGGLAVVSDRYWHARSALASADLQWDSGPLAGYSTERQRADYRELLSSGDFIEKKKDKAAAVRAALNGPGIVDATYEVQVQAHATMEPMNCTAHVTADSCELWVPTQGMEITHEVAKQMTGLRDDQIQIHRTYLGGGFGRRLLADFVRIAIDVARQMQRPVKVIWSREEDITYDAFRPPMTHGIRAALGADGYPTAISHKVVSPSHLLYVFPRQKINAQPPWDRPIAPPRAYDSMAVEGLVEVPYEVDTLVEQHFVDTPMSVSVWRTTGHGPNNFALESFVDELARQTGKDPLEYRLRLAKSDPRAIAVLRRVAEMSKWGGPRDAGRGRGIALAKAFNGYVAQVIDVRVDKRAVHVERVWTALDCGQTLDPGIARSNSEGGVVWGLSALRTEVSFTDGKPDQRNFGAFDPLHLWEMPHIETEFVESGANVGGTGELGPVPTLAAFGNAVFDATGERIRSLPISRHNFQLT